MRNILYSGFVTLLLATGLASAQDNPYSAFNKAAYARLKGIMVASAEKMPE